MATENNLQSLISKLEVFERSQDYLDVIEQLKDDGQYDTTANNILEDWTERQTLSTNQRKYMDLYSNIQISFVKYYVFNWLTQDNVQSIIGKLYERLIQKKQLSKLQNAIEFIDEEQSNESFNDDSMLVYIMRMIDARSCAHLLMQCSKDQLERIKDFYEAIEKCLEYQKVRRYLRQIEPTNRNQNSTTLSYLHQFYMGCCTFAVARYSLFNGKLNTNENGVKCVYVLAKYVRVSLDQTDFDRTKSSQYCVRGILTLLTNYISHNYWLNVMNRAFADRTDEDLQAKNPFNINLFCLIIDKILDSERIKKIAFQSGSNDESLLLDSTVVFLNQWIDTQTNDDDDDDQKNTTNSSTSNQLLFLFNTHDNLKTISKIMIPYIDAKYDRLLLMSISLLSIVMSAGDLSNVQTKKETMAKDLLTLIFNFIKQAKEHHGGQFKGIKFDKLLSYLHQFLIQDFIKTEALRYLSQIIQYARERNFIALKILQRISTNPDLTEVLTKNEDFTNFIEIEADQLYRVNPKFYKIIESIRQNLVPISPSPSETVQPSCKYSSKILLKIFIITHIFLFVADQINSTSQAFISYCHEDGKVRETLQEKLRETKLFKKIWVDVNDMEGEMYDTVPKAIKKSKAVFVLLSDDYCASDFCRREWIHAVKYNIQVFTLIVQQKFDRKKYDWVEFLIGQRLYYKMHAEDGIENLIKNVRAFLKEKIEVEDGLICTSPRPNISETQDRLPESPRASITSQVPINQDYLNKPTVSTWTYDDIKNWCIDNHLEKWYPYFEYFDGANLLVFYQDLSKDRTLQFLPKENKLTAFDIARFKSEMEKLLAKQKVATVPKSAVKVKKHIVKRRESKQSVK